MPIQRKALRDKIRSLFGKKQLKPKPFKDEIQKLLQELREKKYYTSPSGQELPKEWEI